MRPPESVTPLKKILLSLLRHHHLLTVPQILEYLSESGRLVNKTSVYRSLETLITNGQIQRQSLGGNEIWYEILQHEHHHDHLVCLVCGTVKQLPCVVELGKLPENFEMAYHTLTIYGTCQKCQKKLHKKV